MCEFHSMWKIINFSTFPQLNLENEKCLKLHVKLLLKSAGQLVRVKHLFTGSIPGLAKRPAVGSKSRYLQDVVLAVDHVVLAVDDEGQRGKGVNRGAVDDVLPGAGDGLSAADHLIKVYFCFGLFTHICLP